MLRIRVAVSLKGARALAERLERTGGVRRRRAPIRRWADGALVVPAVNVALLIVSGSLTLAIQHALAPQDATAP